MEFYKMVLKFLSSFYNEIQTTMRMHFNVGGNSSDIIFVRYRTHTHTFKLYKFLFSNRLGLARY